MTARFLPSLNGLHFDNAFPSGPALTFAAGPIRLGVGNAADGLCGGMVFTALDYWQQGRPPPGHGEPPAPGTPLFRYLVRRLIDSWHLPAGPLAYYGRMAPWVASPGRVERRLAVARQWPAIKASLDAGWPCPLGLVRVRSANPRLLGQNHQVLAFDYECVGSAVRLRVYDPNQADDDDVVIGVDLDPSAAPSPEPSAGPAAVRSLFRVQYAPKVPPFGHDAGGDVRSIVRRRA